MVSIRRSLVLPALLFLIASAFSFTIVTQIKETSASIGDKEYTWLEPVDFVINAVELESAYPWHGIYHVVPSSYKPAQKDESSGDYLEGCSPSDKSVVLVWFMEPKKPGFNFSINLESKVADPDWTKLDCEAGVGYGSWAYLGEVIHCDTMHRGDGIGKSGIIEYRIDSIEGPEYICGYGKGLYGTGYGCTLQNSTNRTVRINFSVRFRLDGSTYSDWISSPGKVTINGASYEINTSLRKGTVEVAGDELNDETRRALGSETSGSTSGTTGGTTAGPGPSGDTSQCSLQIVSINGTSYSSLQDDPEHGVKKIGCVPDSTITVILSGSSNCTYSNLSAKLASGVNAGSTEVIGSPQYSITLSGDGASALNNGKQATVSFTCDQDKINNAPFLQFYASSIYTTCGASGCTRSQSVTVKSEVVKFEIAVDTATGSEKAEGESPTVAELDDFLLGIGECSPEIQSVDITNSIENGKIYICDEQKNAVQNTISVSLGESSCSIQQTCITLWRQNPISDSGLGSADLSGDGTVSDEEKYYFTLLWWLYVAGEHYGLEPYGTDAENNFKTRAEETLSSYFYEQVAMITWNTWFAHNTYTKCFDSSSEPFSFSVSKDSTETQFLNPDVGLFEQNIYLTVQQKADFEGKNVWFIARNYFTLPLVNNCAETAGGGSQGTEQPSGGQQGPIVVNGPVNPEQPSGGTQGTEQPSGPTQPEQLAGCNPCLSPIGCLGCIDILILQSLPHQ